MHKLFDGKLKVVNVGLPGFKQALDQAEIESVQVDWRPPVAVDQALWNRAKSMLPAIEQANRKVVEILLAATPQWVGMGRALDVVPGLEPELMLHAGPPVTWERMCGPMRGAIMAALLYEKRAATPQEAEALAASGKIKYAPCHEHDSVGPMAGIISPSMPVYIVKNEAFGNYSYSTLNEGLGKVLRYGAYSDDVLERLRWMEAVLYPALRRAIELGYSDLDWLQQDPDLAGLKSSKAFKQLLTQVKP